MVSLMNLKVFTFEKFLLYALAAWLGCAPTLGFASLSVRQEGLSLRRTLFENTKRIF
jgi:hypothetical protein